MFESPPTSPILHQSPNQVHLEECHLLVSFASLCSYMYESCSDIRSLAYVKLTFLTWLILIENPVTCRFVCSPAAKFTVPLARNVLFPSFLEKTLYSWCRQSKETSCLCTIGYNLYLFSTQFKKKISIRYI